MDFIREKSNTFEVFENLCVRISNEKDCSSRKIVRIRSDYGKEFENVIFAKFCNKHGIAHEFSTPKTP